MAVVAVRREAHRGAAAGSAPSSSSASSPTAPKAARARGRAAGGRAPPARRRAGRAAAPRGGAGAAGRLPREGDADAAATVDGIPALLVSAAVAASGGAAFADEEIAASTAAAAQVDLSSFSSYLLYFLPIVFYAIFTVYRTSFNPQAKVGDFVFIIAASIVIGNIFSILFLKTRLF